MKTVCSAYSDVGTTREINQDSVFCASVSSKKNTMAVVGIFDGVGGLQKGEVASQLVRDCIKTWWNELIEWVDVDTVDFELVISHLMDVIERANEELYEYMCANNLSMGTTLSVLVVLRDRYMVIQSGDSRIYVLRANDLYQLTVDDSASRLVNGQMKGFLSNYVGKNPDLWCTKNEGTCISGDIFLVCCDGFYHNLDVHDLSFNKSEKDNPKKLEKRCKELAELMMARGEKDNVSVGIAIIN